MTKGPYDSLNSFAIKTSPIKSIFSYFIISSMSMVHTSHRNLTKACSMKAKTHMISKTIAWIL